MKIALINPTAAPKIRRTAKYPPVRLCYCAGLLGQDGHDVLIWDGKVKVRERIAGEVAQFGPDLIVFYYGLSFTNRSETVTFILKKQLETLTKTLRNSTITIMGPHIQLLGQKVLEDNLIRDFAHLLIIGEENVLRSVANCGTPAVDHFVRVPGLLVKQDGKWLHTGDSHRIENLDSMGFQKFYGLDMTRYQYHAMVATRGCTQKCAFCSTPLVYGNHYRLRSPQSIVEEMKIISTRYGSKLFTFVDDNLLVNRDWFLELLGTLRQSKIPLKWKCIAGLRVDTITPYLIHEAHSSGCIGIGYGVECGDDVVLSAVGKKFLSKDIVRAIKINESQGICSQIFLMVGNMGETAASREKTKEIFFEALPSEVVVNYAYPVENTIFGRWVQSHGRKNYRAYTTLFAHYHNYEILPPPFETPEFPSKERIRTLREYLKLKIATGSIGEMIWASLCFLWQNRGKYAIDTIDFVRYWLRYHLAKRRR